MKAFQAYAKDSVITRDTPRAAAVEFFEKYPNKRKCNVTSGEIDQGFFRMTFNLRSGVMPQSWKDITKKTALELPQ